MSNLSPSSMSSQQSNYTQSLPSSSSSSTAIISSLSAPPDRSASPTSESSQATTPIAITSVRRPREEDNEIIEPGARQLKKVRGNASYGILLLQKQFKSLCKNPPDGMSFGLIDDDITRWRILIEGPIDTVFEGGIFPCTLEFPKEYPNRPPMMRFETTGFWHPNVFKDGRVCISILHEAVEDRYLAHEPLSERWRPILGIDHILLSVISILSDPNCDSPANVDASVEFQKDYPTYKKKVRALVRRSQEDI